MKSKIFWVILATIGGILITGLLLYKNYSKDTQSANYSAQTMTAGRVEIKAMPKELKPGREMVFAISLNNHQINLSYDFTKIAAIVDNNGNVYRPVKWTGGEGGHHISGDLVFGKLSDKARQVGLNLAGIDGQKVMLDWELQ